MSKSASSSKSLWLRTPKFVYGAAAGTIIGILAVLTNPIIAANILIGLLVITAYIVLTSRQQNKSRTQRGKSTNNWSPKTFSPAPVLGALVIGVMSIAGVQYLGKSLAWHPQGKITKSVQNLTTNGPIVDANSSAALIVKPGDTLNYVIAISNVAPNAPNRYNDMAFTTMTDTLPTGIQLVSDPAKRTITEDFGILLPGKSAVKMYQVKVTSAINGSVIENTACYTADSVVKDNPQKGCDAAVIKIQVPATPTPPAATPSTPTPPPTPTPSPTPPSPVPSPTPVTPLPSPTPSPTPTPVTPNPTPIPTPPSSTVTPTPAVPVTPTPSTSTITLPTQLPTVGPRNIIIVALLAAVSGYLFTVLHGMMSSRVKRFGSK